MTLEIHCVHRENPEEFCGDFISSLALAWTYAYTMSTTDTKLTNSKGFSLSPHQTHTLTSTTYLIQLYMKHIHVHNTHNCTDLQLRPTVKQIPARVHTRSEEAAVLGCETPLVLRGPSKLWGPI